MQHQKPSNSAYYPALLGITLILLIVSLLFTYRFQSHLMESYEREQKITQLADSLLKHRSEIRREQPSIPMMNQREYGQLEGSGIENPENDLVTDLMGRADLIPFDGIAGGTMGFYAPENIFIMNDRWVFAYFEDGHIAGNMLLEFTVTEGEIEWRVLEAYLYE